MQPLIPDKIIYGISLLKLFQWFPKAVRIKPHHFKLNYKTYLIDSTSISLNCLLSHILCFKGTGFLKCFRLFLSQDLCNSWLLFLRYVFLWFSYSWHFIFLCLRLTAPLQSDLSLTRDLVIHHHIILFIWRTLFTLQYKFYLFCWFLN